MTVKKILFVLPTLSGGGAERVFVLLLRHFDRSRFEIHVALLQRDDPARVEPKLPADVVVHRLARGRVMSAMPGLVRLVRSVRPAAVFSALGYVNLAALAMKPFFPRGTRVLAREANTPSSSITSTRHPALFRKLYALLYPHADGIVCQSEGIRQDLLRVLGATPPCPLVIAVNPVDKQEITRLADAAFATFPEAKGPRIVAAGRLTHQKGFDLLIKAFAALRGEFSGATLTILGSGEKYDELAAQILRSGLAACVTLAGFQENPYPYFAGADLFALSSRWEGMSNAALEALVCGTPVVSWRGAGAAAEIVTDGVNGILVEGDDPSDFAAGMAAALRTFSGRARMDLLPQHFRLDAAVKRYEDFVWRTVSP